jgi:hypothetical protein
MSIRRDNRNKFNCASTINFVLAITRNNALITRRCVLIIAFAIVDKTFIANSASIVLIIIDETLIATTIISLQSIKRSFFYTRSF